MMALVNWIISGIATAGIALLSLLPTSPFTTMTINNTVLGYINYFFPVAEATAFFTTWLVAVVTYYILRWGLRWAKLAEG